MIPEVRPLCHCTVRVGSVLLCLSGRTRSSGAPELWSQGQALAILNAGTDADGIDRIVGADTTTSLALMSGLMEAARPPEARSFFWYRAQKNPSWSGMLQDGVQLVPSRGLCER